MKVGDLVKKVNPWTRHNPWMVFDDDEEVGLVVNAPEIGSCVVGVLIGGKVVNFTKKVLEVVND
jgi:hypothetical protein